MKVLIRIVVALLAILLFAVAVSYVLPGSYHVERMIDINAPAEVVFTRVGDLKQWPTWTVWQEHDPQVKTEYSSPSNGVGAWQRWEGPKAGKGEMKITAVEPPSRLEYALHFIDNDMHSVGEITIMSAAGNSVRVTWTNGGRLGFNPMLRWFGLLFDRFIGNDFSAGLERLKKISEAQPKV